MERQSLIQAHLGALWHTSPPHSPNTHTTSTWPGPLLWSELLPLLYFPIKKLLRTQSC